MDLSDGPKPRREENVTPMINVVFLLLIFFLMTAQIAPPEPFAVEPPSAKSDVPADGMLTLYLGPEGAIGFRDALEEEPALAALQDEYTALCAEVDFDCDDPKQRPIIVLRADGKAMANRLPDLLKKMAEREMTNIQLATSEVFAEEGQ